MSRGKRLLLLLTILVIFIGAYYYITNKPTSVEEPDTVVDENQRLSVIDLDSESIERILLKAGNENIVLVNGETPTIEGIEKDVLIKADKIKNVFNSFSTIESEKVVEENTSGLQKYGLDNPTASVTAVIKNTDPIILHIGNKTVDGKNYYIRLEGEKTVYLMPSYKGNNFVVKLDDFRDDSLPNIDTEYCSYILIEAQGKPPIEIALNENIDSESASYGIGIYSVTKPYPVKRDANTASYDELIQCLPDFRAEKFIDDNGSDLSKYGLDNPVLRLKLQSNNREAGQIKDVDVLFGAAFEEKYVYFKYADDAKIYGMKNYFMKPLLELKAFDLIEKLIYLTNIKNIKQVEVANTSTSYTFDIHNITTKNEDGTENIEQEFFYNDKQLDDEGFRKLYQAIIGLAADAEVHTIKEAKGDEVVTITYTFQDDSKKSLTYKSYNDLFYYYELGENIYFLSSSKQIDSMFNKIEEEINK